MCLPNAAVLMIIDLQKAIDDPAWGRRNNPDAEAHIAELLAAWRAAGMTVLHIRHDSTEPHSPYRPCQPGNDFKPEAMPHAGEIVVAKEANSAFIGTDLEAILTELGVTDLVIAGVLTNNSLEATVRHAGNLGYRVFVPADTCWAVDKRDLTGHLWPAEAVHQLSLANMQGEYAQVTSTAGVLDALRTTVARRKS